MTDNKRALDNAAAWFEKIKGMVAALASALDAADEAACKRDHDIIHDSVLAVRVRDSWRDPLDPNDRGTPEEYEILLTTGGSRLRLYGDLNQDGESGPYAVLQWQYEGTPWTDWYPADMNGIPYRNILRDFASCFYFSL